MTSGNQDVSSSVVRMKSFLNILGMKTKHETIQFSSVVVLEFGFGLKSNMKPLFKVFVSSSEAF